MTRTFQRNGKTYIDDRKPTVPQKLQQLPCLRRGTSRKLERFSGCGSCNAPTVNDCELLGACVDTREQLQKVRQAANGASGIAVCAECPHRLVEPLAPLRDLSGVQIISVHFNPTGFGLLSENHRQWVESLGSLKAQMTSLEAVFDGQRIPGSVQIPATADNAIWQKEQLINYGLTLSDSKYVAWIDADMVADWPAILSDGIARLERGAKAVQLFSWVRHTDASGKYAFMKLGAVEKTRGKYDPHGCPGGAWIARREDMLKVGGLFALNLVGGGDEAWYAGLYGDEPIPQSRERMCPQWFRDAAWEWSRRAFEVFQGRVDRVPVILQHLWHGDMRNRRYGERWESVYELQEDWLDSSGPLLSWTEAAPQEARERVASYFVGRDR